MIPLDVLVFLTALEMKYKLHRKTVFGYLRSELIGFVLLPLQMQFLLPVFFFVVIDNYISGGPQPAAKYFGKSPADRHLSLQERKEALYNFARR